MEALSWKFMAVHHHITFHPTNTRHASSSRPHCISAALAQDCFGSAAALGGLRRSRMRGQ
jgi:hypothetical protein